jgi:hypothetical protein
MEAVQRDTAAVAATSLLERAVFHTRTSSTLVLVCSSVKARVASSPTTIGFVLVTLVRDVDTVLPSRIPSDEPYGVGGGGSHSNVIGRVSGVPGGKQH